MDSVLSRAQKAAVKSAPFPYLVIKDAIDPGLCARLIAEYPSVDTITEGVRYLSNERFSLSAVFAKGNEKVSPLWQEFLAAHVSKEFLDQLFGLFTDQIREQYPDFEKQYRPLPDFRVGLRKRDGYENAEALLDAQICVNTPVQGEPSSVRRGHLDLPNKMFARLFYLRHPNDDSTGGDLEILRYKSGKPGLLKGQFLADEDVEVVETVKYEKNVLVMFLNTPYSIHSVTCRSVTDMPRFFMNLACEVKNPLFDLNTIQLDSEVWLKEVNDLLKPLASRAPIRNSEPDVFSGTGGLQTLEVLAKALTEEFVDIRDELAWEKQDRARVENEYRARVIELEQELHQLVSSSTWKVGRVFTKPIDILTK